MTFIISAATGNIALQIADTRVTDAADGSVKDDFFIKTIVLHCIDAKLILSFTGLATIRGVRVDKWMESKLLKFEAWNRVFQEIMNYLKDEATSAAKLDVNLQKFGLEIVVIGLGLSPTGIRQPAIAIITNLSEPAKNTNRFSRIDPLGRPFARYILEPEKIRHYIGISGATGAGKLAINGLRRKLEKQLKRLPDNEDPRSTLDRMVAMLRLHRRLPSLGRVIGEHCVGIAIKSDFTVVSGSYGPSGGALLVPTFINGPAP
jgi:hypothetical protein